MRITTERKSLTELLQSDAGRPNMKAQWMGIGTKKPPSLGAGTLFSSALHLNPRLGKYINCSHPVLVLCPLWSLSTWDVFQEVRRGGPIFAISYSPILPKWRRRDKTKVTVYLRSVTCLLLCSSPQDIPMGLFTSTAWSRHACPQGLQGSWETYGCIGMQSPLALPINSIGALLISFPMES
jgi:hypothetical protein